MAASSQSEYNINVINPQFTTLFFVGYWNCWDNDSDGGVWPQLGQSSVHLGLYLHWWTCYHCHLDQRLHHCHRWKDICLWGRKTPWLHAISITWLWLEDQRETITVPWSTQSRLKLLLPYPLLISSVYKRICDWYHTHHICCGYNLHWKG